MTAALTDLMRPILSDPADDGYEENRPLFAGETQSLHDRIFTHKNGGLPDWLEPGKNECITLAYTPTPDAKREARLGWLQRFINHERPLLNYQRAA